MKVDGIEIEQAIAKAEHLIKSKSQDTNLLLALLSTMLMLVKTLFGQLNLDSHNSSRPPSTNSLKGNSNKEGDEKKKKRKGNPRGGQNGHKGTTLKPVDSPDHIKVLKIDRRTLPKGQYTEAGYMARQIVEMITRREVTEIRAQVLVDQNGNKFTAPFPEGVTRPIQYGSSVKANAVYLSQYQLIPFGRIQAQFTEQYNTPISMGSVSNFNQEAHKRLEPFEKMVKQALIQSEQAHADETGINVDGKRIWLHAVSNAIWTFFAPHIKRGTEAMEAIGIIPLFLGVLCHDHWKPYYQYACTHALCNAHHLRELIRAFEQDNQQWADKMEKLLLRINKAVDKAGGALLQGSYYRWRKKYRDLIAEAEIECPPPDEPKKKRRGRVKRSKARNLLERLRDYESDVLRFMTDKRVPFTNNQGERDIRMTKVQQKISGCFRSMEGAHTFCRVRSYLSTCKKNNVGAAEALDLLFKGKFPDFIQKNIDQHSKQAE